MDTNTLHQSDPAAPRGWHSRGYMPHYDSPDVLQHITFHLADSLPAAAVDRIMAELHRTDPADRDRERRRRLESLLDAGHGGCILRRPDVAGLVQDSLLHFDAVRYRLVAWTIMPNHVHVLIQTMAGWRMGGIVASWKSFTGRRISAILRREGMTPESVWYREYWDRYIRDERHYETVLEYIHNNPVKAGLVVRPADWRWGSASAEIS